jgi:hypothetical protein
VAYPGARLSDLCAAFSPLVGLGGVSHVPPPLDPVDLRCSGWPAVLLRALCVAFHERRDSSAPGRGAPPAPVPGLSGPAPAAAPSRRNDLLAGLSAEGVPGAATRGLTCFLLVYQYDAKEAGHDDSAES